MNSPTKEEMKIQAWKVIDYPGHPTWENTFIALVEPKWQGHRTIKEITLVEEISPLPELEDKSEEVEKLKLEIRLLKQEVAEMSVALHKAEEDLQYD